MYLIKIKLSIIGLRGLGKGGRNVTGSQFVRNRTNDQPRKFVTDVCLRTIYISASHTFELLGLRYC